MAYKQRSISRSSKNKKKTINGIGKFKNVLEKLVQKSLSSPAKKPCSDEYDDDESTCSYVPEDVKEGHFAVIAVDMTDDQQNRRFVVPLTFLEHPRVLKLLEQSAEEYGFDHDGALMVPCRPSELQMILAQQWREN